VAGDRAVRAGTEQWRAAGNRETFMLYGQRVGLIGYGNLARMLMPLLAPFGCTIVERQLELPVATIRTAG
jgi:phosphoglycerate dehydrogenase-like enzyme